MAATPYLTIVKSFTYRDAPEEWSNSYHFTGADPADAAEWKALADEVIAAEALALADVHTIVRAVGHKAGVAVADWSYDYAAASEETPGALATGTSRLTSGDVAAWIRWSTDQLTSKGKPIYLRSYFHGLFAASATEPDKLEATMSTAMTTYGQAWADGFASGARKRAGPNGAVGQTVLVSEFLTTRTLERRGKRP